MDITPIPVDERRWLRRVLDDEAKSAVLLLVAAVSGLALAQLAPGLAEIIHTAEIPFVNLTAAEFAADGLLAIFFFVAGLELRHELTVGTLNSWRAATVPVVAAISGMAVPALIFYATTPSEYRAAWGVPMATDLPLALAVVAVFGRRLPLAFRAFLLSLAIADDVGSVLVIALAYGTSFNPLAFVAAAFLCLGYWLVNGSAQPRWLQLLVASGAWWAALNSGVHPTLVGVVLGVITVADAERFREVWQPISSAACVPVFVFTALAIPLAGLTLDADLTQSLVAARIIGKTVGVFGGAFVAAWLLRPASRLPMRQYAAAGAVASLGFSVSMLFAQLSIADTAALAQVQLAVLVAVAAAAVFSATVVRFVKS